MVRLARSAAATFLLFLLMLGIVAWSAYMATQQVRPFYAKAIKHEFELNHLEQASRELETQAGALYSDTRHRGGWRAVFTAEQLNAWLALELERNYVDLLPPTVRDPRVAIDPGRVSLGFRSRKGGIETVLTVDAEVFLTDPNVIAVRLISVRAGALPLPVAQVANEFRKATKRWSWPVRWTRVDGNVVALVEVLSRDDQIVIETLELHEGELYVAGTSQPSDEGVVPIWTGGPKSIGEVGVDEPPREVVKRQAAQSGAQSSRQ